MSKSVRPHHREALIARREKNNLPFGSSTASVGGYRNLLYLHSKGLIADPRTPRLAAEVQLDNTYRATKKDNLQWRRGGLQAAQEAANDKWLYPHRYRKGAATTWLRK